MFLDLPAETFHAKASNALVEKTTPRIGAANAHLTETWLEEETKHHNELRSNTSGIANRRLRTLPDTYFRPEWRFRNAELWPHQSWFGEHASTWLKAPIEVFQHRAKNLCEQIVIDLTNFRDTVPCGQPYDQPVVGLIEQSKRDRDLNFSIRYSSSRTGVDQVLAAQIGLIADYLWTGLRRTPASINSIAHCLRSFSACARLYVDDASRWDFCYKECYVDHLALEYAPLGGHSRTAKVLCTDLACAVRPDLNEVIDLISENEIILADHAMVANHLQQMIYPQYLFDFDAFAEVFITRVLPYEAFVAGVIRRELDSVAFNPRLIKVFGLA